MYIDKDILEDKIYQTKHQFNGKKITPVRCYTILLNKIHPFFDGKGRTCKILCTNDDKIINLSTEQKSKKLII